MSYLREKATHRNAKHPDPFAPIRAIRGQKPGPPHRASRIAAADFGHVGASDLARENLFVPLEYSESAVCVLEPSYAITPDTGNLVTAFHPDEPILGSLTATPGVPLWLRSCCLCTLHFLCGL